MPTTTPTTHLNPTALTIAIVTLTALAAVCVWLGPPVYRVLQIASTGVLAIVVATLTARSAVKLLRDLLAADE